jgi:hypothetical protein
VRDLRAETTRRCQYLEDLVQRARAGNQVIMYATGTVIDELLASLDASRLDNNKAEFGVKAEIYYQNIGGVEEVVLVVNHLVDLTFDCISQRYWSPTYSI